MPFDGHDPECPRRDFKTDNPKLLNAACCVAVICFMAYFSLVIRGPEILHFARYF